MQVDTGLKYSPSNWRETLASFIPEHNVNKLEIEPFPDEQVLACLAQLVYSDCTSKDLKLPPDWELLTTARNNSYWIGNGYYGCAVWNRLQQQVIIAHRGTDWKKVTPLWADFRGIYLNNYTDHMNSAVTFVDDIKEAILEKNNQETNKQFCRFVLSISGHSLGAWLAGVTTLTVKYLKNKGSGFCRVANPGEGLHARTLALDSPGTEEMLIKICGDFDMRYNRSMSSKQLDITTYFIAPNLVSCTGLHVGDIYQVHIKRVPPSWWEDWIGWNNMETHGVDKFIEAFKNGKEKYVVLDWPQRGSERKCFHKLERLHDSHILQPNDEQVPPESSDGSNRITITQPEPVQGSSGSMHSEEKPRYGIIPSEGNTRQLGVFSEEEFNFTHNWSLFKRDELLKLTAIDSFTSEHNLGQIKFPEFKIDTMRNTITCTTREDLRTVLRQSKQLLRWYPGIMDAMAKQNNSIKISPLYLTGQTYLRNLPDIMDCGDTLEFELFLGSSEHVLIIKTTDLKFEAARLNNILMGIINTELDEMYLKIDRHTFLSWNDLADMAKDIDMEALGKIDVTINNLLVLEFDSPIDDSLPNYDTLKKYIKSLETCRKKLVMIVSKAYDSQLFNDNEGLVLTQPLVKPLKAFELSDLTLASREEILARDAIALGEETLSLQILLGDDGGSDELNQFISPILMNMVTNYNYIAEIELTEE